jgi:hypothetical protein
MKMKWLKVTMVAAALAAMGMGLESTTGAGPDNQKVTLCHKGQSLEVPESAVKAHLNHGDTLGPCNITPSKNR